MKYYFAPLEGVTNLIFRNAYDKVYSNIDKYFIPFLAPKDKTLHQKELRETDFNKNKLNGKVVPQIISKNSEDTIWLINYLKSIGYDEINLNFGCPSKTVTEKKKGSGILKDLELMDNYLTEVFKNTNIKISIKLRIGYESIEEFDGIINILNKYNIYELIIHPRTGLEEYSSKLHLDILKNLDKRTKFDIIYNGEIKTNEDIEFIKNELPYIKGVMIGRGLLNNPSMLIKLSDLEKRNKIKEFYKEIENQNILEFGFNNSKFFLKEIWAFLIEYFECDKQIKKSLFRSNDKNEFISIADQIINSSKIKEINKSIKDYI